MAKITFVFTYWMLADPVEDKVTRTWQNYDLLVNGYMRSGTTFTGRVMSLNANTFYWFEPLWNYHSGVYYLGPDKVCHDTFNASCRHVEPWPSSDKLHPHKMKRVLEHLFRCELSPLVPAIAEGMTDIKSGESWTDYRSCRKQKNHQAACIEALQDVCKNAKHRITKVVRMTVDNLEHVLETNPKIKVIHIFRDPRAIINSRLREDWYQLVENRGTNYSEIKANAKDLCDRMIYDFRAGFDLKRKYPNRFSFILYEDLMENTMSRLKVLYSFIGADSTILESKFEKLSLPFEGIFLVQSPSGKNFSSWWRSCLKYDIIKIIDVICSDVYNALGYIGLGNNATLSDKAVPSYNIREKFQIENIYLH